jgi:hypothetical protein
VIRPWQLRWGATDEEVRRAMPGDEIVACPTFNATRAVTVAAPPSLIWPWIMQIGFGRAGWDSYDLLDNFGRPSATRIIPELQHLQPGDVVPFHQGIGAPEGVGMKVKALQPELWVLWWDELACEDRTQASPRPPRCLRRLPTRQEGPWVSGEELVGGVTH